MPPPASLTLPDEPATVAPMAQRKKGSSRRKRNRAGVHSKRSGGGGPARRAQRAPQHGRAQRPPGRGRALVPVDERPIRRSAITKCKYILRQLDKVAAELDAYENEDLPAHRSWYFRSFGPQLTQLRELDEEARSRAAFLQEVRRLIFWERLRPDEAYRLADERRRRPAEEHADDGNSGGRFSDAWDDDLGEDGTWHDGAGGEGGGFDGDPGDDPFEDDFDEDGGLSEEELFAVFADLLRSAGYDRIDPDSEMVRRLFAEFKARFGYGRGDSGAGDTGREETGRPEEESSVSPDDSDAIVRERLKSLYRQIAKELHPDNRRGHTSGLSESAARELWYRVQQAYADEDLDELQMLAAQHSIRRRNSFAGLPVSRILAVHRDRKEELRWIRKRHREARKTTAWGFTQLSEAERAELHRAEEEALSRQISFLRSQKAEIEAELERYRNPPHQPERKRRKRTKESEVPEGQLSLF